MTRKLLLQALFGAGLATCARADDAGVNAPTPMGDCKSVSAPDLTLLKIRSARIRDPFSFLRWRRPSAQTLAAVAALVGKPYHFDTVNEVDKLVEKETWLPDTTDVRASFNLSLISLENCRDGQLDVVFDIFSAQISSTLSSTIEFHKQEQSQPQNATGVSKSVATAASSGVQFSPEVGSNPADGFLAGGRLLGHWNAGPLTSIDLQGYGSSSSSRKLSAALAGQHDSATAWLAHIDWRLDFLNTMADVQAAGSRDPIQLGTSRLALQFAAMSHPVKGAVFRFGGMLDGGNLQSGFRASATDTIGNTHYTSTRVYGGVSAHSSHQALAASAGLVLGSNGNSFGGDWRKLVGDVAHDLWVPIADHRLLEIEQRFTAGGIQTPGRVPVAERFFGGNREESFLPGDNWSFRANPVIRSIGASRLYQTTAGPGGDRFFSYNSTFAFTTARQPIVPAELSGDPEFQKKLHGAITSQQHVLEVLYLSEDSHFAAIQAELPDLAAGVNALAAAVKAAQTAAPAATRTDFQTCSDNTASASMAVRHAIADKRPQAYGWVQQLLPDGDDALADVSSACGDLVVKLRALAIDTTAIEAALKTVAIHDAQIQQQFGLINNAAAQIKAVNDMAYVQRTINIITKEMNITSISPVAIFDAARIGPNSVGPYRGTRYAVGGGVRFTLVSTVSVTAGYAFNLHRRPGEGAGAFFFTLTTRNLFE